MIEELGKTASAYSLVVGDIGELVPSTSLVVGMIVAGKMVEGMMGRSFVLGSSCRIECGEPTMGPSIFGSLAVACRLVLAGKLARPDIGELHKLALVGGSFAGPVGTRPARLHRCR